MMVIDKELDNNSETYKFLGITICKINKDYNYKLKNILGLISKEKYFNDYTETVYLKLLNITLCKRVETLDSIDTSILKVFKFHTSKVNEEKKYLKKIINPSYNKVFILKSNLGETYLFLKYIINELITCDDLPLILATKKSQISLIKMLTPNIKYKLIKPLKYEVNNKILKIGEQTIVYIIYPLKFYIDTENKIQKTNICYLDEMYNYFRISNGNKHNINKIHITYTTKNDVNRYLQDRNLGKFIFVAKDATTTSPISNTFWEKLEQAINIKVIYNDNNEELSKVYYLAQKAVSIISLRSGLSEVLSDGDTPNIVLYTDFKNRYRFKRIDQKSVMKSYSIKNIEPNRNNITEIQYTPSEEDKIIEGIVNTIKRGEGVK